MYAQAVLISIAELEAGTTPTSNALSSIAVVGVHTRTVACITVPDACTLGTDLVSCRLCHCH